MKSFVESNINSFALIANLLVYPPTSGEMRLSNGLTVAMPTSTTVYLEDNREVYAGLAAFADLLARVGNACCNGTQHCGNWHCGEAGWFYLADGTTPLSTGL